MLEHVAVEQPCKVDRFEVISYKSLITYLTSVITELTVLTVVNCLAPSYNCS